MLKKDQKKLEEGETITVWREVLKNHQNFFKKLQAWLSSGQIDDLFQPGNEVNLTVTYP